MVKLLLAQSAINANSKTNMNSTPLHISCVRGATESCKELLSFSIQKTNELGTSEIMYPIDVNSMDDCQMTPLHYAAQEGFAEIVHALLNFPGIDVNCRNSSGNTPLHLAVENKHKDIIMDLLSHKDIKPALLNENIQMIILLMEFTYYYISYDTPADLLLDSELVSLLQYFPLNEELNDSK